MSFIDGLLRRKRLITERQDSLLEELRGVLHGLDEAFQRFGADVDPADQRTLRETLAHLTELFLIVVAGEFNAGKSSFLNALLGEQVLPEGVTPTTDAITLLQHGDEPSSSLKSSGLRVTTYPAEVLRQLTIVDTPGTNAVIRHHEQLTREFIPRADLVLFATSADRPFTESERGFLELIKEWGKKIIIVLNKIDNLSPEEREQVLGFVRDNARTLLGVTPEIFAVSARQAMRARQAEGEERERLWESSNFGEIEHYIVDTLDEEARVRLKLLSPLGVAQKLTGKYLGVTESRLETLRADLETMDNVDQQLGLFKDDLQNDVKYYLGEIDQILQDLVTRGDNFFDEHIRLGRLPDLMNGDKFRGMFEQEVVGDVNQQIEQKVGTLVDWMVEKNLRLQQSTDEYIKRRASQHTEKLIGNVGGSFDYNRRALLDSVGKKTAFLRHVVEQLGLTNVHIITGRAEDLGRDPHERERHSVVTARAVGALSVLAEYGLPLLRIGGLLLAPKGAAAQEEIAAAKQAIQTLGGAIVGVESVALPGVEPRTLVIIAKVAPTNRSFPRAVGLPPRKPL